MDYFIPNVYLQASSSYREENGSEQHIRFFDGASLSWRWMAFHVMFPIVMGRLTVSEAESCAYIEEAGVWLQLVEAVSSLKRYFVRRFREERHDR